MHPHHRFHLLFLACLLLLPPLLIARTHPASRPRKAQPSIPYALAEPDNWLGGTGNWSLAGNWSDGIPLESSDVFIGTGNDFVTLDMDAAINSLTLGTGVGSALLQGDGSLHSLLISGALDVGSAGSARFTTTYVTLGADSQNSGAIDLQKATSVTFARNLDNSGVLTTHSSQDCWPFCEDSNKLIALGNINNTGSLGIYGSDSMTVKGTLTNAGQLLVDYSALDISIAKLVNTGIATLSPGRDTNLNIGEVWNSGTLNIPNGYSRAGVSFQSTTNTATGAITVTNGGSAFGRLINDGSINLSYGNSLADDITNRGTIYLDHRDFYAYNVENFGTLNIANASYASLSSVVNYGSVNIVDPLSWADVHGKIVNRAGAQIAIGGELVFMNGSELKNAGTVSIGSGSLFTVGSGSAESGYVQGSDGVLGEVIGPAYFGLIRTDNAASLDGTLSIFLEDGFVPELGSSYKFFYFAPGELIGQFALIENQYFNDGTEMWQILYDSEGGFIELTAVPSPEPASMMLLGSGLLAIAAGCRQRLG